MEGLYVQLEKMGIEMKYVGIGGVYSALSSPPLAPGLED
jgi:hypothetical protein